MTRLSLALLGPTQLTLDGQPISAFYNKARALLAYLAVESYRPHQRDALATLLWPEMADEAARHSLRQALTNLREAIGDASARPPFLLITRDTIQFNPASDYSLDIATFMALLRACESHAHRRLEHCRSCATRMQQAISLYGGEFLAGFGVCSSAPFEEWQLRQRERLHQHALDALARLADYHERRSDNELARRYLQRQIELEPWREEAHRQLMRLLARAGQRSAALAQYETCRHMLERDLGVEPEAETTALYQRIRDNSRAEVHAPKGQPQRVLTVQNFPAQTTALIGREAELLELGALLENPAHRLITIVGPGGIGKTRLVLAAARDQADAFADSAVFVPLAAISSNAFLAPAILEALDIPLLGQHDPREQLIDTLRSKELLLVLDNFEQLLALEASENDSGAVLLTEILQRAPGVTLLVTSRERLALLGEWLVDLSGLRYPLGESDDDIEGYSAVHMFLQRASHMRRPFALADGEAHSVARICWLVEGLPLAIELAAAALHTHSCAAIADSIESSLLVLATGLRAVPERHRSIWATFEHSWHLLSDEERQVFARLAVFRGGFDQEAATQVTQATPQILARLVDKSLLRWDGVARYDLHELVRQYASKKLEQAGEMDQARGMHLSHYLALAEAAEPELVGAKQIVWMGRLDIEHDNVRAALRWALEQGDGMAALQLSANMGEFWEVRGYWSEGRQWLEQALALNRTVDTGGNLPSGVQNWPAHAFWQAGTLAWRQCDYATARKLLEQSLTMYRKLGNSERLTSVLGTLGGVVFEQGDYPTAKALYEEHLAARRAVGDPVWMSDALFCVGLVAYHQGEYAIAQKLLQESLKLAREAGNSLVTTYPLNALGNLANLQGDYAAAQIYYEECLTLRRKLAYKRGIAATLADVANLSVKLAQCTTARTLFEESLTIYRELGNKRGVISVLAGLACLAQIQGRLLTAARLLGVVEALLAQLHARLDEPHYSDMEQTITAARAQLGEEAFAAAWAAGHVMTLKEAIGYALITQ
jgi:predicted ATPase/DNA-binding SARP family transcriptional activator